MPYKPFPKIPSRIPTPISIQSSTPSITLTANITLRSFMPDHLDFIAYYTQKSALQFGMQTNQIIHKKDELDKWWVIKGPFVHAKTKEVFERRTYARLIQIFNTHPQTFSAFTKYINESLPAGIEMHVEEFTYHDSIDEYINAAKDIKETKAKEFEGIDPEFMASQGKNVDKNDFDRRVRARMEEFMKVLTK